MNDKRNKLTVHASKKYKKRKLSDIKKIAIHHSATIQGSAEAFARYHVNHLGWPGIGYHYVINKDGSIDQCHDLEVKSYHVGNSNQFAVGICLVGDFTKEKPTNEQYQATIVLTRKLLTEHNLTIDDVWGHSQFPGYSTKNCPAFSMDTFRNDLKPNEPIVKYQDKEVKAILVDGRTYVQVRELAELLQLNIHWDQKTKTVTLK